MDQKITPEQLEIRKAQWNLYTEAFKKGFDYYVKNGDPAMSGIDICYDASSLAEEAITLFNDFFSGRGLGPLVLEHREENRKKQVKDSEYDWLDHKPKGDN